MKKRYRKILAYFTAAWCGPCRMISPKFSELSDCFADIKFIKIDVDASCSAPLSEKYGIRSMPTFVFIANGETMHKFSGANSSDLESWSKKLSECS